MEYGEAIIVDHLSSAETDQSQLVIYDREIGVRLLYQDPESGAEHYLIRYPAGLEYGCIDIPLPKRSSFSKADLLSTTRSSVQVRSVISRRERRCFMLPPTTNSACSSPSSTVPLT
jgi:hypothetical protein